jgi:hypothetical protein
MLFVLLTVALTVAHACPSTQDAFNCIQHTLDTNNDTRIVPEELHKVYNYLPWWKKIPFDLFGGIDQVIRDCDQNGDMVLTIEESLSMSHCIESCFKVNNIFTVLGCYGES